MDMSHHPAVLAVAKALSSDGTVETLAVELPEVALRVFPYLASLRADTSYVAHFEDGWEPTSDIQWRDMKGTGVIWSDEETGDGGICKLTDDGDLYGYRFYTGSGDLSAPDVYVVPDDQGEPAGITQGSIVWITVGSRSVLGHVKSCSFYDGDWDIEYDILHSGQNAVFTCARWKQNVDGGTVQLLRR